MGIDTAIELTRAVFGGTSFSGTTLIMQVIIIIGTCALITRKINRWGDIALLVGIGWNLSGLVYISPLIISILSVTFVINTLSVEGISKVFSETEKIVGSMTSEARLKRRMKEAEKQVSKNKEKEKYNKNLNKLYENEVSGWGSGKIIEEMRLAKMNPIKEEESKFMKDTKRKIELEEKARTKGLKQYEKTQLKLINAKLSASEHSTAQVMKTLKAKDAVNRKAYERGEMSRKEYERAQARLIGEKKNIIDENKKSQREMMNEWKKTKLETRRHENAIYDRREEDYLIKKEMERIKKNNYKIRKGNRKLITDSDIMSWNPEDNEY